MSVQLYLDTWAYRITDVTLLMLCLLSFFSFGKHMQYMNNMPYNFWQKWHNKVIIIIISISIIIFRGKHRQSNQIIHSNMNVSGGSYQ